jgi:hypothetical protein
MFGGNRFKNFFPWMQTNLTNGAVRTQFSLAIFTNPKLPGNRRLSLQWLRGKILDNQIGDQVPDFIGFRPALDHSRFNRALELRMTGNSYAKNLNDQFRGLIVQGEYEKNGYSLMTANRERGDLQFEAIAPNITRNMERAISTGFLRNTDPLDRRLFVQNWAFGNSESTLIERIRRNAIRVETLPDFWQIRVDIHNFPTTVELAKTKRYLASFNGDQNSRVILETLVKDLENFLGVDSKTGNNFVSIVEKLKLTNEHSDELKKFAKKFDNLSEEKKLKKLELVRTKFNDLKTSETSATKTIDRIIGEKTLSDQAALISNEYLQTIKKSGEIHDSKKVSASNGNMTIILNTAVNELQDVVLVGSRGGGRVKTESPVPVDVIKLSDVGINTARMDLTSTLNFVAPSFNYNKQSGADGADHIEIGTLRGLGPDQTLVLINGKRRHSTAFVGLFGTRGRGNSGVDLNGFPQSSVYRIEILRDGASAQYGSDAIAGVLNVVLKKETCLSCIFIKFIYSVIANTRKLSLVILTPSFFKFLRNTSYFSTTFFLNKKLENGCIG